jgi:hypothetical protein
MAAKKRPNEASKLKAAEVGRRKDMIGNSRSSKGP